MQEYTIKFTPKAINEIIALFEYIFIDLKNPLGANRIIKNIYKKCYRLGIFPKISPVRAVRQNRELRFVHIKHYTIIYYIDEAEGIVYITHVVNSRRDILGMIEN